MIDPDGLADRLPDDLSDLAEAEGVALHVNGSPDLPGRWPCGCMPSLIAAAAWSANGPWYEGHRPTCPSNPFYDPDNTEEST